MFGRRLIFAIIILFIAIAFTAGYFYFHNKKIESINNFEECASHGFPVTLSYPRQCSAGDKSFVEKISDENLNSGVEGIVTIGPTCPVMRFPDNGVCADKPYEADIDVFSGAGDLIKTISSGQDGRFTINLSAGEYALSARNKTGSVMPRGSTQKVIVNSGEFTQVKIQFDSGIR